MRSLTLLCLQRSFSQVRSPCTGSGGFGCGHIILGATIQSPRPLLQPKEKHMKSHAGEWLWPCREEDTTLHTLQCLELSHTGTGNWSSFVSRKKRGK